MPLDRSDWAKLQEWMGPQYYILSAKRKAMTSQHSFINTSMGCKPTTFVKHFIFTGNRSQKEEYSVHDYVAGYFNTTSAIDEISFKMSSGNFDGVIKMYGVG